MSFKIYAGIFCVAVVFFTSLFVAVNKYIEHSIETGTKASICETHLQSQNEAIKEQALNKEVIKTHNESQNERLEELEFKYSIIQSNAQSCEAKLNELEKSIRVFYGKN